MNKPLVRRDPLRVSGATDTSVTNQRVDGRFDVGATVRSLMPPSCWSRCTARRPGGHPAFVFHDCDRVFCSRMVRIIADEFLTEERDRKYYADQYTCCPPPLFILCITLIEVRIFLRSSVPFRGPSLEKVYLS